MPETLRDYEKSTLFKLVSFRYILEDRRPDLHWKEANNQLGYKYKHVIYIRFLWYKVGIVINSIYTGGFFVNGKEIE